MERRRPDPMHSQQSSSAAPSSDAVREALIELFSAATGLPVELFKDSTALESDLGIDCVLQAEALIDASKLFDAGDALDGISSEHLGGRTTLAMLVKLLIGGTISTEPAREPNVIPAGQPIEEGGLTKVFAASESPLPIVFSEGSAYDIGKHHGEQQPGPTKAIMQRMTEILGPRILTMTELHDALADPTIYFEDEDIEELRGLADGLEVPFESAIAHNLGFYPAYIPGCAQCSVPAGRNGEYELVHIANEDSPVSSMLGRTMSRVIQARRPKQGNNSVVYAIAGQIGGLNGINSAGLAVTTTILLDRPRREETAFGRIHPLIVKSVLQHADDIDSAIDFIQSQKRMGGWSMCLSHYPSNRLCYLEYDGDEIQIRRDPETVLTTNHCLLFEPLTGVPKHSKIRLERLNSLLKINDGGHLVPATARDVLRDRFDLERNCIPKHPTKNTIRRVDNQASIVMQPEKGNLWITAGPQCPERENDYFKFDLNALLHGSRSALFTDVASGSSETASQSVDSGQSVGTTP